MTRDTVASALAALTLGVAALALSRSRPPHVARPADPDSLRAIAIVGVATIPMDAPTVDLGQTVLIRRGRIVAMGPEGDVPMPRGTLQIDGHGKYLLPGLVDAHVHLLGERSTPDFALYLANGVTTVRNMQGAPLHLRLRDELARGERLGPTLYTASAFADDDAVHSPEEARRFVQKAHARGYDAIKVHRPLPPPLFEAVTAEARRLGIPVVGHAPDSRVTLAGAASAGQRTVEHAESIMQEGTNQRDPDTGDIAPLVHQLAGTGVCVTPTLVVFQTVIRMTEQYPALSGLVARPAMQYVDPTLRAEWGPGSNEYVTRWRGHESDVPGALVKFRRQFAWMQRLTKALADAGIPIIAGSDASAAMVIPGFSLPEEVRLLHDAGLSPYQALAAATRDAAICLGGGTEFGTIGVGKRADLVLLASNPLADLTALSAPVGVMVRGRWFAAPELERQLRRLATRGLTLDPPAFRER
jgi:imidazolonepropionase-like amidohydrolase